MKHRATNDVVFEARLDVSRVRSAVSTARGLASVNYYSIFGATSDEVAVDDDI